MILYNINYRGPYNYDKFILNVFQFHNEVKDFIEKIELDNTDSIKYFEREINNILDTLYKTEENLTLALEMRTRL